MNDYKMHNKSHIQYTSLSTIERFITIKVSSENIYGEIHQD